MKIGYLLQQAPEIRQPPFDGPATHVREVVRELAGLGHPVRLLARLQGQVYVADDLEHFRPVRVAAIDGGPLRLLERVIRRAQSALRLPYLNLFESLRFASACRQELQDADLLYERSSWMGFGGAMAARWLRKPLILEYNGDPLHDLAARGLDPHGLQGWLARRLSQAAVNQADHVIASGEGWKRQFMERWGFRLERVSTVENGSALVRMLARAQLRSFQAGAGDGSVRLVYLGAFYPWHGVQILLRALGQVVNRGIPVRLQLVGTGDGHEQARQLTRELGLEALVEFPGHLAPEGYAPLLAQSDIGLSPYCGWREYSGLKLLDYKAAGLAIIASGEGGQPATLRHGHTGWIVPPCEEGLLAEAIVQLATDQGLRARLGQAARLEAEQVHGWDRTARELDRILGHVVGTTAARIGQPVGEQHASHG